MLQLGHDWKAVLTKAWSVRFIVAFIALELAGVWLSVRGAFSDNEALSLALQLTGAALDCIKRPMTDGQKAAFLSFAFNVGNRAFCDSTLARKANAGDMAGACAELSRWTYAGGKQLPGLVRRRATERAVCEGQGA